MNKQLLVDVRPFDISRTQIDESIKENDGRLVVKGVLQRAESKNQSEDNFQTKYCCRHSEHVFAISNPDSLELHHRLLQTAQVFQHGHHCEPLGDADHDHPADQRADQAAPHPIYQVDRALAHFRPAGSTCPGGPHYLHSVADGEQ